MRAAILVALCLAFASAQTAYSVSSDGTFFRFSLTDAADTVVIGTLPFVPSGIDFRPGTSELFAIVLNDTSAQLWTININDASVTPVGPGFASSGAGYTLTNGGAIGFDFNPKTLQVDGSIRIRLIDSTTASNLRLHSATGLIAATDTGLNVGGTPVPGISSVAYINNFPELSGTTTLYALGAGILFSVIPPNNGVLNGVATFSQDFSTSGFDVYTNAGINYPYAVIPVGGSPLLYSVDLFASSGSPVLTLEGIVGRDTSGGFSIDPLSAPDAPCATFPATAAPLCNAVSTSCPTNFNNARVSICAFTTGVWSKRAFLTATARDKLLSASFGVPGEFYNGNCCDCACSCFKVGFTLPGVST